MKITVKTLTLFVFIVFPMFLCPAAYAAAGTVAGTITLEMEDGRVEPGNWIRILLVTEAAELPEIDTTQNPAGPGYVDYVNSLHSRFYIRVQNHLPEKGYLIASTLSTDEGTFKIPAVEPGGYFVLITFPGNIRGYKVAWQVPVKVESGKTTIINLDRSNMALPTAKR